MQRDSPGAASAAPARSAGPRPANTVALHLSRPARLQRQRPHRQEATNIPFGCVRSQPVPCTVAETGRASAVPARRSAAQDSPEPPAGTRRLDRWLQRRLPTDRHGPPRAARVCYTTTHNETPRIRQTGARRSSRALNRDRSAARRLRRILAPQHEAALPTGQGKIYCAQRTENVTSGGCR